MSNKNVRIYFDGLMVFYFQDKQADGKCQECKVGILTMAEGHEVKLKITRKRTSQADETRIYTLPHDQLKHFKHLWLYLSKAGESRTCDPSVIRHPSFDQAFDMKRHYDPKPYPMWDAMRPTLHITTGEFWAACLNNDDVCRLVDIEGVMSLFTPLFNAKPAAVKTKLEKALDLFTKSHQEIGKLANVFWTDIAVEGDQRLALAVGDERAPITELFSVTPGDGETFEASLTNLPIDGASTPSHQHAHQEEGDSDSPDDSHEHHGAQASPTAKADRKKEENRRNYLKKKFHFLHYYDVLKFQKGQKHYVLLQDNQDWIEGKRKRGIVPDPPCDLIEC